MNEETWKRIKELDKQIAGLRQDIGIASSEQTAAAVLQARYGTDHNPCIARIMMKGQPLAVLYYRSDEWIEQPISIPEYDIQAYVGIAKDAPEPLYGPGSFIVDVAITNFHLKNIMGFAHKQTAQPKTTQSPSRKRLV